MTDRSVITKLDETAMKQQLGKEKILDAAIRLFASNGYHRTSVNQIASSAGVSKGLTYNYFSSKEDLLLAIINQASDDMSEVADNMASPDDYQKTLKGFLGAYVGFVKTNKTFLTFQLSLLFQPDLREIVAAPLQKRANALLKQVDALFKKAGVPQSLMTARRLISELDGVALHYLSVFENYPLDKMKQQIYNNYKDLQK